MVILEEQVGPRVLDTWVFSLNTRKDHYEKKFYKYPTNMLRVNNHTQKGVIVKKESILTFKIY